MGLSADFRDLLGELASAEAHYLLVGGYAVGFHSRPRFTKDIDIWIGEDPENLERVYQALASFGTPEHLLETLRTLAPDEILYMGSPPARVDVFKRIPGVTFDAAFRRRVRTEWDGVPVLVIGIDDLIAAKRAVGREQDLLDVKELEQSKDR